MAGLHDCHVCKYVLSQISGIGKQRVYCTKYNQPIKRVRRHCFDLYISFGHELMEINRQYLRGECSLVINGVEIKYEEENNSTSNGLK
jgi:hypothetical protein